VKTQVDAASLGGMSPLSQQKLKEVDASFKNSHEIASIHQNHEAPTRRVLAYPIVRIAIDGEVKTQSVVELPGQFPRERVKSGRVHRRLLPFGFEQVVRRLKRKGPVYLLARDFERGFRVEIENCEKVAQQGCELVATLLRIRPDNSSK